MTPYLRAFIALDIRRVNFHVVNEPEKRRFLHLFRQIQMHDVIVVWVRAPLQTSGFQICVVGVDLYSEIECSFQIIDIGQRDAVEIFQRQLRVLVIIRFHFVLKTHNSLTFTCNIFFHFLGVFMRG